jgi:hypothetical protein
MYGVPVLLAAVAMVVAWVRVGLGKSCCSKGDAFLECVVSWCLSGWAHIYVVQPGLLHVQQYCALGKSCVLKNKNVCHLCRSTLTA